MGDFFDTHDFYPHPRPTTSNHDPRPTTVSHTHILDERHLLTLFHSEVDKTASSKQTRSFHVRKTIQCSNFPNAIFVRVDESISQVNILFSIILNSLLQMLPHIFYNYRIPGHFIYMSLHSKTTIVIYLQPM